MWLDDFVSLIFPETCVSCGFALYRGEEGICVKCKLKIPFTNFHKEEDNLVIRKFKGKVNVAKAFSFLHFVKSGKVQKLMHELKYNKREDVGLLLGKWYGRILLEDGMGDYDLIVTVPMHKKKKRKRGYNQVDSFAQGLSESMSVEWQPDILQKVNHTESQTKKGRFERWKNVNEVFIFNPNYNILNQKIMLVDDVITTGATLESCINILHKQNIQSVNVCTIACAK